MQRATLPDQIAALNASYVAALARLPDGQTKETGVNARRTCRCELILAARANDGSADAQSPYVPTPKRQVPISSRPHSTSLRSSAGVRSSLSPCSGSQFRVAAPFALTDPGYTADFNEVKALGEARSGTRTADQAQIARFWLENTPLSWQRIAMKLADEKRLNGWDQMHLFALLQVAEADAYVASFDSRYFYSFWRPITAIRAAATDGNPDTTADAAWTSLEPAPPIPDHASGHAAAAGAGAAVLESVFAGFRWRSHIRALRAWRGCRAASSASRRPSRRSAHRASTSGSTSRAR